MKERPILFNGAMVRAILDGRKTQTRRIVKNQRHPYGHLLTEDEVAAEFNDGTCAVRCPYGGPGDRLWVRETWAATGEFAGMKISELGEFGARIRDTNIVYRADGDGYDEVSQSWRPSIHMPRWASRTTLEITGVRIERLRAITEYDAIAEGIEECHCEVQNTRVWRNYTPENGWTSRVSAKSSYRSLWEKINGSASWIENSWVWVIEFRRAA